MIYMLLAAYNEQNDLPGLLEAIKNQNWQWKYKIFLVNDGSNDNTRNVAVEFQKALPIEILDHFQNQGLGRALSTGFGAISKLISDTDLLVTMDADNTHLPDLIPAMKQEIEQGYDAVIASRFCRGGRQLGLSYSRRFLSKAASSFLKMAFPIKNVSDYTSGYRMFSGNLIRKLFQHYGNALINEKGFSATLEILLKARSFTNKFIEVPLVLHYEKKIGASKMKIFKTIMNYLVLIFRNRFNKN